MKKLQAYGSFVGNKLALKLLIVSQQSVFVQILCSFSPGQGLLSSRMWLPFTLLDNGAGCLGFRGAQSDVFPQGAIKHSRHYLCCGYVDGIAGDCGSEKF